MVKIRKYANVVERFLHGEKGQRFFNFAYSIGAAIVIWGALFKILHLPGGSLLLCIGMGTEIAMFILTAFDRPPKEYAWEEVFPVLDSKNAADRPEFSSHPEVVGMGGGVYPAAEYDEATAGVAVAPGVVGGAVGHGGGATVIGGGVVGGGIVGGGVAAPGVAGGTVVINGGGGGSVPELPELPKVADFAEVSSEYVSQMQSIAEQMATLNETYSQQMQDLNRNVAGLNTIYEIQLKSISSQLETIDHVNRGLKDIRDMYEKSANESTRYCEETEKMARYMRQLNAVYEKMITAMTINMQPMMGGASVSPFPAAEAEKEDSDN